MGNIKSFESLDVWQKSRELARAIYQVTSTGEFRRDFGLKDQIRRASVSVMSNIAEGFERDGDREFSRFLTIAKGSVGEIRAQLYIAADNRFLTQNEFEELRELSSRVGKLIGGFIRYLGHSQKHVLKRATRDARPETKTSEVTP